MLDQLANIVKAIGEVFRRVWDWWQKMYPAVPRKTVRLVPRSRRHWWHVGSVRKKPAMQLERIEFGGTVHVITPYDEGVLQHRQMIEQLPVVCNTQLYLDLFQHPTRGKEAAEFLRKERMKI